VGGLEGRASIHRRELSSKRVRQWIIDFGSEQLQRLMHQHPLQLRGHRTCPLVHRHDASGMDGVILSFRRPAPLVDVSLVAVFPRKDLVVRAGQLQTGSGPQLHGAVQNHPLMRLEDVL
jgi:hypothetical protein